LQFSALSGVWLSRGNRINLGRFENTVNEFTIYPKIVSGGSILYLSEMNEVNLRIDS